MKTFHTQGIVFSGTRAKNEANPGRIRFTTYEKQRSVAIAFVVGVEVWTSTPSSDLRLAMKRSISATARSTRSRRGPGTRASWGLAIAGAEGCC